MSEPDGGYKFGQKNQWRRTIWKRIAERLMVPPRDAIVLYLAGPDNLDRAVALRHGFKERNLIAVDRDASVVRKLRGTGQLSIAADFVDVLESWNPSGQVHVVFGDFCSGLHDSLVDRLSVAILRPCFWNGVVAFNFCRGREMAKEWMAYYAARTPPEFAKHRGRAFFIRATFEAAKAAMGDDPDFDWTSETAIREVGAAMFELCLEAGRPDMLTYRSPSAQQTFDSIVWASPFASAVNHPRRQEFDDRARAIRSRSVRLGAVSRRIAATLAHRTMYNDRRR